VAPDGHEYALVGCYSGTSIIDLDANPIAEVAYVPGANSEWKELKVWGQYAYAVSENPSMGLQIIDLSQLPDTAWVANTVFNVGGRNVANTHTITVADGFLYLNGGSSNGTVILDISDPEHPAYAGEYQPEYLHDTYVKRDTLYGAAIYGGGVYIADVSDKSAPQQVGHITYLGSGTHNTWKSDYGSYLFTTDEIGTTAKNMKAFDITSLPSYTQMSPFTADPSSIIHNVHGRGNYVYIAHYNAGAFVADIHDPSNILNAGQYDTYTGGQTGYIGCWGVYPYFPSGRWIASDTQTGLYVLDFDGLAPRIRSPLLAPADGSSIPNGSDITFRWRAATRQDEDPHYYDVHVWGTGIDTVIRTTDTTLTAVALPGLVSGETYSWSLWIKDEFTAVTSQDTFAFTMGTELTLLGQLNVRPGADYSALWGYTAPDGREYAVLGVQGGGGHPGGTSFIDITDPSNMYEAAFVTGPTSLWREMKTYDHYAYIVTESGGGVQIIDLSALPDTAWLVRSFNYQNGGRNISSSHTISIHDGIMYLNGSSGWSPGGIVMFDLRQDPENPVYLGNYQPGYVHDCYVLRDTIYAAGIYGNGLFIGDARNKASVQTINTITYSGAGTHNAWVTKDRRFVITTDEIGTTPKTLKIWDITDLPSVPSSPTATYTSNPGEIEHNVTIRGDYAYVAWYGDGVQVVDITDPAHPGNAGGFDQTGNEVWGVYPFFPSGKIIGGDMVYGLYVFSFSALVPREPVSLFTPADGDTVGPSTIEFTWTPAADMDADPHYYEVHLTGAGVDTTWRADGTMSSFDGTDLLQTGETYLWSVVTRDEWNTTLSADTFSIVWTGVTGVEKPEVPLTFRLEQNYPNPFNPVTTIRYEIDERSDVSLRVFNILGQQVAVLVNGSQAPGKYSLSFDASQLSSGVYFYKLTAGINTTTRKMVLTR
jgi:choice-of-anchor B domain-containing protein